MDKPYQRDIELLRKELECYKYVADNCKKEHSEQFQRYLTTTCLELRYAIDTMEERQKIAVKGAGGTSIKGTGENAGTAFSGSRRNLRQRKREILSGAFRLYSAVYYRISHGSGGLQIPARIKANNRCM